MKLLALLILAGALSGCGVVVTFYPSGKVETAEATFLKHTAIASYQSDGKGAKKLGAVTAQTDDNALASVVQGVGMAIKTIVGIP